MNFLGQEEIHAIHGAAIEAGLAHSRLVLLGGLPQDFVDSLPHLDSPSHQTLSDLNILNCARLVNGIDALSQWLASAESLTKARELSDVFMRARIHRDPACRPSSSHPTRPSVAPSRQVDPASLRRYRNDLLRKMHECERYGEGDIALLRAELAEVSAQLLSLRALQANDWLSDRFRLEQRIGSGQVSEVWRAFDAKENREVALRILRPHLRDHERARERFIRGIGYMKELDDCPRVVRLLHDFEPSDPDSGGHLFYSSRLYGEGDLAAAVNFGKIDKSTCLELIRDVGEALTTLHERKLFHRDVSPSNVLLNREQHAGKTVLRALLGDFDTVICPSDERLTMDRSHLGQWGYIAPEVLAYISRAEALGDCEPVDIQKAIAGDIYALAATALFALTGISPPQDLREDSEIFKKVPPSLQATIRKGCAPRWEDRFLSAQDFLAALKLESPRDVVSGVMDRMRALQGNPCTAALSSMAHDQIEACAIVFAHADDPYIRDLLERKLDTLSDLPANTRTIQANAHAFLRCIQRFRIHSAAESARALSGGARHLDSVVDALEALNGLSENIRYESMGPDETLFVEYLFGLGYFEVFAYFGAIFVDLEELDRTSEAGGPDISDSRCRTLHGTNHLGQSYVDGLGEAFERHDKSMDYLRTWYRGQNRKRVWINILERWTKLETPHGDAVRRAIQRAVSLRGIPEGNPQIITLAQVMHWAGWGGQGRLFERAPLYCNSQLARVFRDHQNQAFDWHGLSNDVLNVNFSHRRNFFAAAIEKLADYSGGVTAVLLSHPTLTEDDSNSNGNGRLIRIWGDAVGPKRVSERRIMENATLCTQYMRLGNKVRFKLTASDVSAPTLALLSRERLLEGSPELEQRELVWRDLNLDFPGEPSCPPTQYTPKASSYDCYSCAISLHQVADRRSLRQHGRIRSIFAFATRIVRPGGVIAVPDVGRGVALQVFLLPTNLVDREGGWGGDLFSITCATTGTRLHRFIDVASTLDGSYVSSMPAEERAHIEHRDERLKIPLPLLRLHRGAPSILAEAAISMYEAIPYLVISLPWSIVTQLDNTWCNAVAKGRGAALADEFLDRWRPGASTAVGGAADIVDKLGYELANRPPPGHGSECGGPNELW